MQKMKILEITVSHRSDDTRIYQKYVKSLLDADFEVGYIAPDPLINEEPGLTILPVKKSAYLWARIFGLIKKIPEIRKFNPSFIHLHDPELLLISPFIRFFGFKIIYDMHENFYRELDDKPISWLSNRSQKLVWRFIEKYILNKMPVVFAEASYAKHFNFISETMIIQNFPRKKSFSKRYQPEMIKHDKVKFVYLGTISEDRGAKKMIRSLTRAFGASNFELNFIGDITDPTLETSLQHVFSKHKNIIFHGYQSMDDAWNICKDCDVGLAILDPKDNYMESYPTKLFEYLICGLPVITSNFELYRGLVEKYNLGLCVNPMSDDEISNALRNIIKEAKYSEFAASIGLFPFHDFAWEFEFTKFVNYLRRI